MARKTTSFRVGRVRGDLRGQVWYLTYHENGKRHRSRSGQDLSEAKKLASQINVQLETGVPAVLSFDSISIEDLRTRWLDHHEHVTRSSVHTIKRYRSATQHLINFLSQHRVPQVTAQFRLEHAEQFARYLRTLEVTSQWSSPFGFTSVTRQGSSLHPALLSFPVQLCHQKATSASLQRQPFQQSGIRSDVC